VRQARGERRRRHEAKMQASLHDDVTRKNLHGSPNVGVSVGMLQLALPRQAAFTTSMVLAALQLAFTAQVPQLPEGVP